MCKIVDDQTKVDMVTEDHATKEGLSKVNLNQESTQQRREEMAGT